MAAAATGQAASSTLPVLPPGEEIYDIHGPVMIPYPWLQVALQWTLIAVAAWIVWRLWRWWCREVPVIAPPPPPIDHRKEALAALDRLRQSQLWAKGQVKDVCEHLTLILKEFLHGRFSLGIGGAATSDELVRDFRGQRVPPPLLQPLSELLTLCDEIKFAKGTLGNRTMEDLFGQVRQMVMREDWAR